MILGIELGTTNSLAALWRDAAAKIIPNSRGENLTPSCVSIDAKRGGLRALHGKCRSIIGLRTANTLDIGVGRLRMTENLHKNELSSVAAAEVYFQGLVPRTDGKVEYPGLFNPYWQARLTEPTTAQRVEALL